MGRLSSTPPSTRQRWPITTGGSTPGKALVARAASSTDPSVSGTSSPVRRSTASRARGNARSAKVSSGGMNCARKARSLSPASSPRRGRRRSTSRTRRRRLDIRRAMNSRLGGRQSGGIGRRQHSTHAGPRDAVDGDPLALENFEDPDVSEAPHPASAQRQPNRWPVHLSLSPTEARSGALAPLPAGAGRPDHHRRAWPPFAGGR